MGEVARRTRVFGSAVALVGLVLPVVASTATGAAPHARTLTTLVAGGDPRALLVVMLTFAVFGATLAAVPLAGLRRVCFASLAAAFLLVLGHEGRLLVGGWVTLAGLIASCLPWEWLAGLRTSGAPRNAELMTPDRAGPAVS